MALAALDDMGRHGAGDSALLVVPQAALLLDGHPVNQPQRGEALLAGTAMVSLAHAALAHALLVSEDRSASRRVYI